MAPDRPLREMSAAEVTAYEEDGVVCLRGVLPAAWTARMAAAIDATVADPPPVARVFSRQDEGFTGGIFMWKQEAPYHDFIFQGPGAHIARQAMGGQRINCFFDHLFVKQPGCQLPTPWHQDLPYWPLKGWQVCSLWMPFDAVSRQTSGLEFVAGSHRWPQDFRPQTITKGAIDGSVSGLEAPPDIEAGRADYDIRSWDMEPGDALLFHARILHGAGGNASLTRQRRALAIRFTGDDVTWDPQPWKLKMLWESGLEPGAPLGGSLFPQLLPDSGDGPGFPPFKGPDLPPAERLEAFRRRIAG